VIERLAAMPGFYTRRSGTLKVADAFVALYGDRRSRKTMHCTAWKETFRPGRPTKLTIVSGYGNACLRLALSRSHGTKPLTPRHKPFRRDEVAPLLRGLSLGDSRLGDDWRGHTGQRLADCVLVSANAEMISSATDRARHT
jgi:hypothetical protein